VKPGLAKIDLAECWTRCFIDLDVAVPPPCAFDEIVARYSEPHRAYHTTQHLQECFGRFEFARALIQRPGEVAVAPFYHDAIHDTHARDSEEQSATLAANVLEEYCSADQEAVERVRTLILATKHDAVPADNDAKLLVDMDLAILGADRARFDEYEAQVRFEYSWGSPEDFRKGRADVLRHFLARESIYSTEMFRTRLESAARSNLARSLAALG
jgi:predicted metal-dependent HD superfamily phosphohydrolase